MQLDGGRGGGAQHILEWGVFGLVLGGEAGVLLLEDRQSQHIAGTQRDEKEEFNQQFITLIYFNQPSDPPDDLCKTKQPVNCNNLYPNIFDHFSVQKKIKWEII